MHRNESRQVCIEKLLARLGTVLAVLFLQQDSLLLHWRLIFLQHYAVGSTTGLVSATTTWLGFSNRCHTPSFQYDNTSRTLSSAKETGKEEIHILTKRP